MLPALSQVDPTSLPQTGVWGLPTVRGVDPVSAVVSVPIVGGDSILVTVVVEGGRLLVSGAALPSLESPVDW